MTGLLIITFLLAGIHTLLWLPKSLQWRNELKARHNSNADATDEDNNNDNEKNDEKS